MATRLGTASFACPVRFRSEGLIPRSTQASLHTKKTLDQSNRPTYSVKVLGNKKKNWWPPMLNQDFDEIVDRLTSIIAVRVQARIGASMGRGWIAARLLTVKEAADYIGRTEQAVQHLIHKRELIVVR